MFKYFIFDLDNTLFNFDFAYQKGLIEIFKEIDEKDFKTEKKLFQKTCSGFSYSHNKLIQIKKTCEKLKKKNYLDIYQSFLNEFLENSFLFDNVLDYLKLLKNNQCHLYILTNNLCEIQIKLLEKLNILDYFDKIYTSEEFNLEKPNPNFLKLVLYDIGCQKEEIVMVGDNFKNDIEMSIDCNIYGFYFNKRFEMNKNYLVFENYHQLINLFEEYYQDINDFIYFSKYFGQRWDLTQAGGGNSSVKIRNLIFIKASGCNMTEIDNHKNFIGLDYLNVLNEIKTINSDNKKERENLSKNIINKYHYFNKNYQGSIESAMHCLTKKFTIHLHPIQLLKILTQKDTKILTELFPNSLIIDYETPGIDVCLNILRNFDNQQLIFLKNHGVVLSSDNVDDLINLTEDVIEKVENNLLLDYKKYKFVNVLSETLKKITGKNMYGYLSNLKEIREGVSFPDKLIYCGQSFVNCLDNLGNEIKNYIEKYEEIPIFFKKEENYYIVSTSLKRCKDIEDVMMLNLEIEAESFLLEEEIKYLNNWDAEKYRKNIK